MLVPRYWGTRSFRERVYVTSSYPRAYGQASFRGLMPIPIIENDLAPTDYKIGPPESLITDYSVDKIVIKRLGDQALGLS